MPDDDTPVVSQEALHCARCKTTREHDVIDAGYSRERAGTLQVTKCTGCGHSALWVMQLNDSGEIEAELVYPR